MRIIAIAGKNCSKGEIFTEILIRICCLAALVKISCQQRPPKMIVILMTLVDLLVNAVLVLLLLRLREWRSQYEGPRRLPVADQDLEEGAAAGWSEEEMAADSPSVASYEASNNTFNSSPPPAVPDPMAAAVQRDGVLTSTPQSQRSSDLDQGYNSRQSSPSSQSSQSSPSSSPRYCRHCMDVEIEALSESFRSLQIE